MLENVCIASITVLCAEVLGPVAGLLLPCKKVPHSRVVKEVQQNHLASHPFLRHTHIDIISSSSLQLKELKAALICETVKMFIYI